MHIVCVCARTCGVYLCTTACLVPVGSAEDIISLGTRISGDFKLQYGCWNRTRSHWRVASIPTAEPSPLLLFFSFLLGLLLHCGVNPAWLHVRDKLDYRDDCSLFISLDWQLGDTWAVRQMCADVIETCLQLLLTNLRTCNSFKFYIFIWETPWG